MGVSLFFFSSRRRHTRYIGDWSSDVCSSDLGMKLSIGFSLSFIRQAQMWDQTLLDLFRELVAEDNVELIGVEPYHSFLFLLEIGRASCRESVFSSDCAVDVQ